MPKIQVKQIDLTGFPYAIPAPGNQNMTCSVTTLDGQLATATTVATNNATSNGTGGKMWTTVNGVEYDVGNGTKVGVPVYVSGDGGVTARGYSAIVTGDQFYWNQSVALFNLAAADRMSAFYNSIF